MPMQRTAEETHMTSRCSARILARRDAGQGSTAACLIRGCLERERNTERGNSVYRIERCIMDTREEFRDGSHIVYVNGSYRDSSPIGRLMHDFSCTSPDEMNYKVLADRVRYYKESKEGVDKMCRAVENLVEKYGKQYEEIGEKRGAANEKKERILRLLADGTLPVQKIASIYDLQVEDVERIQREYLNK